MTNPIDEAIDVLDDVLSWGDTPSHILKNASAAMTGLLTLKADYVIIPKADIPEGLIEPDKDMMKKGYDAWHDGKSHHGIYKSMISAAPEPICCPQQNGLWKDIESAPRDGNAFLVCLPRQQNLILRARFCKVHKYFTTDRMSEGIIQPTFFQDDDVWQHLPAAPKINEGE